MCKAKNNKRRGNRECLARRTVVDTQSVVFGEELLAKKVKMGLFVLC